jgi:hypothetical protein
LKLSRRTISISVAVALGLFPNLALATPDQVDPEKVTKRFDSLANTKHEAYSEGHPHQHGGEAGHLPPTSENVELVGKLQLTNIEDKISDVATLGNFAYLGEWAGGLTNNNCSGGIHVVDISNPRTPKKAGFLPSHRGTYATEGIHALHVDTPSFTGDLLVVSNEACTADGIGGLTLWDITNPRKAVLLSEGAGDFTNGDIGSPDLDLVAHESHSAMGWDAGNKAYVIAIDNTEGLDVDFFDVTNPRNPVILSETGLEEWPSVAVDAFGDFPTSHDFDVRFINNHWFAFISYWDAGWVLLNVDNPANPVLIEDTDYPECDVFIGAPGSDVDPRSCPPEGNGHQGEWSEDGKLWLGTDEDFSPNRLLPITVTAQTSGPGAATPQPPVGTEYAGGEFGWTIPISTIADGIINGPVVWGGYGCDENNLIPSASVLDPFMSGDPNEERILVTQRGPVSDPGEPYEACFFSTKVENAQNAGYDAVIVANHHVGSGFGSEPDSFFCGGQGHTFTITASGLCSGHRSMHEWFGSTPNYGTSSTAPGYPEADMNAAIGVVGPKIESSSFFDGWGYVSLYEADPKGGFTFLDALAIDEQNKDEFASGFGDLTVHEVTTGKGPDKNLAYFSWYSGGFRVAKFSRRGGLQEVGAYIDEGGHDFWGVQLTDKFIDGRRVVALSDLDFGLYLYRYTGP